MCKCAEGLRIESFGGNRTAVLIDKRRSASNRTPDQERTLLHTGDVVVIEQVEAVGKDAHTHPLSERELSREAKVDILLPGQMQRITAYGWQITQSACTIDALTPPTSSVPPVIR